MTNNFFTVNFIFLILQGNFIKLYCQKFFCGKYMYLISMTQFLQRGLKFPTIVVVTNYRDEINVVITALICIFVAMHEILSQQLNLL